MLEGLNEQQRNAVLGSFAQDTLVLAGAGAGKSKTIVERVKYILDEKHAEPSSIMCITFTNKAAHELLDRVKKVCKEADEMWVGTFHSICIRLLRMFGDEIGLYDFTILDPYNSKKSAIDVLTKMGAVVSKEILNNYLSRISHLKNELMTSKKYRESILKKYTNVYEAQTDPEYQFCQFYTNYQRENLKNQTIDFDDIILYTILLLKLSKNAQNFVAKHFKYIHVDETQDSNTSNITLFKLLSANCNLFIVGDIDQSIYGWRGAKPKYLLDNRKDYRLFKLEQNYRSTQKIVNASNCVIANNVDRIDKTCFSENRVGDSITLKSFTKDFDEAKFIADEIKAYNKLGIKYSDIFILYRTNAQSRVFEETFIKAGVPYTIIGALGFNERKEIKDCLAFLRVSINHKDKQSLKRALMCLDGIGKKATENILDLYDIKRDAVQALKSYKPKGRKANDSINFLLDLLNLVKTKPYAVIKKIGQYFIDKFKIENTPQSNERIENIEELVKVSEEKEKSGLVIEEFITQMDLLSSKDKESKADTVSMMTIHASKGLEASIVFGVGINEGILPHNNSLNTPEALEEERRLMYVLMTRAKDKLYLTNFGSNGQKDFRESRFIHEIPTAYIEKI